MKTRISAAEIQSPFVLEVEAISGENLYACNQCGKCSAGCPVAFHLDLLPNQVIRMVQLGIEDVLQARTIWTCAACLTCLTRCPKGVDLPRIMEALRLIRMQRSGNVLEADDLPADRMVELPQLAIISAFRKYSS
jgi:heterodisulfide reductase subunit C